MKNVMPFSFFTAEKLLAMLTFFSIFFLWDYHPYGLDLRWLPFVSVLMALYRQKGEPLKFMPAWGYLILILVCFHLIFVVEFYDLAITGREVKSIALLGAILFFVRLWGRSFDGWLPRAFKYLIWITFLTQLAEYAGVLDYSSHADSVLYGLERRSGIFSEPSHLGLTYVAMWAVIFNRFSYWCKCLGIESIIVAVCSSILAFSLTLIAGLGIILLLQIFVVRLKKKRLKEVGINLFLLAIIGVLVIQFPYVKDRLLPMLTMMKSPSQINISRDDNLSSAVYLNGINVAVRSVNEYPLGVGFNMYQVSHHKFSKTDHELRFMNLDGLNEYDGSSNFIKILTEYGVFSFLIFIFIFITTFKTYKTNREVYIFSVILILLSCVRGAGYFNAGMIVALFWLFFYEFGDESKKGE